MAVIAYARVSTDEQTTASPTDVLRRAGCSMIFEERA
jgi:DNA invertase Pin-like site-specific DNA recombinase